MTGGTEGQIVDGRFELLEQLGRGGMGTVWRARDTTLHREVALKEVRPADPESAESEPSTGPGGSPAARMLRERVLREARALARLNDPHVVTIHHIVDEGPYPWLVMELLPGETLQDRLREGPLTPRAAARTGLELLAALRTAHAAGIQHRDVKPANVLLRADGSAVLTDFGIAALQGSTTLTATGEFLGSPEYIAPERIRGVDEDPASDLWSLGMTLYVCTEGHSPLRRGTSMATLTAVLDEPVPPPVRSGELAPVLAALLVRDREQRPDAEQLRRMLTAAAEGREPGDDGDATGAAGAAGGAGAAGRGPDLPTETAVPQRPAFTPPAPPAPPAHQAYSHPAYGQPAYGQQGHGQQGYGQGPFGAADTGPTPGPGYAVGAGGAGGETGAGAGRAARPGRAGLVTVAAVLAAALTAGEAYLLFSPDDGGTGDESGGGPTRAVPTATEDSAKASPDESPSVPGSSQQPGRTPTASASSTPSPSTPPVRGSEDADSWVAQLASVAKSDGTAARDKQQAELDRRTDGVRWLDSDDYASLRSGYWFFYRPGDFGDGHAAARWCSAQGLTSTNQCVGRYLSDESADRVYLCAPDRSRGTGRCER